MTALFPPRIATSFSALCAMLLSGTAMAEPWVDLTKRDLQAVHDILAENHAGPVDDQNPDFREWLIKGREAGMSEAEAVKSLADYQAVMRRYLNGFHDGHVALILSVDAVTRKWPGFTVQQDREGRFRTVLSKADNIPNGTEVTACDSEALSVRLGREIAPQFWNADIPHEKAEDAPRLFFLEFRQKQFKSCDIVINGAAQEIELSWSYMPAHEAREKISSALGYVVPELGVHQDDDVRFVSMPRMFNIPESFFDALKAARADLHEAPVVVLDFRGNQGGDSDNGAQALAILFGLEPVKTLVDSFDWTVDWRVSEGNLATLKTQSRGDEFESEFTAALEAGQKLYRWNSTPRPIPNEYAPKSPFKGKVYVLTDGRCASACLDALDIARRLPGVVHIGLPTSADAIYIDNRSEPLPSGLFSLTFGMKVYRNRIRGHNEFYTPEVMWPGGAMTTEAISAWVRSLPERND